MHERFMRMAIDEARAGLAQGDEPFGSVVVRDGVVVALGRNLVQTTHDPTAHAETVAIRNAGPVAGSADLSGCTIYASWQPCAMCCGAIVNAGIATIVIAGRPAPGEGRLPSYSIEAMLDLLGLTGQVEVISGVLGEESEALVRAWREG